jgi:hypothetical protein
MVKQLLDELILKAAASAIAEEVVDEESTAAGSPTSPVPVPVATRREMLQQQQDSDEEGDGDGELEQLAAERGGQELLLDEEMVEARLTESEQPAFSVAKDNYWYLVLSPPSAVPPHQYRYRWPRAERCCSSSRIVMRRVIVMGVGSWSS